MSKNRLFHKITMWAILCLSIFLLTACTAKDQAPQTAAASEQGTEDSSASASDHPVVEITMKEGGKIQLTLDRKAAPITVDNFLALVNEKFYDGLIFHRIEPGFVIQGGDPEGTGMGGSEKTIEGEFASNKWENPIKHERGVISMARTADNPNSASSQFFITLGDATFLDGDYAAFGVVTEGMDVVDAIAQKDPSDSNATIIESIRVIK